MRAIDADALKELFSEVIGRIAIKPEMNGNLEHMIRASAMVIQMIDDAPTVQPERPTGEWIQKPCYEDDEYPDAQPNLKCPFCGYEIGWCDMGNYCARCGADLKGGAE